MTARRVVAGTVLLLSVAGTLSFVTSSWGTEEFLQHLVFAPVLLAYAGVAAVILWRRSHFMAWYLLALGALLVLSNICDLLVVDRVTPRGTSGAWRLAAVAAAIPFPLFAMLLPGLGLRFPSGQLASPRWRWLERAYALGVGAVVCGMLLTPMVRGGGADGPDRDGPNWLLGNPLSEPWTEPIRTAAELLATVTLFPAIIGSIVAVVLRYRRSSGLERQQMRWLTRSLLSVLITWPVAAGAAFLVFGPRGPEVVAGIWSMLVLAVPAIGIGVAVTRYRLYDLDRLVSRTVSYAIVTAVLVALYAGGVISLGAVLHPVAGDSDLVVALSTLLVAAAFQPVRSRVRALVERRFNRARVDQTTLLEGFGRSIRDEVDSEALGAGIRDTAREALAPRTLSIWLREHSA